jgi:transcriptional regulator with XRE-family HTH domain
MKKRQWLIDLRKERCWSQVYVTKQLGISQKSYSFYETGSRTPNSKTLYKLSKLFGFPMERFFEEQA